MKFFNYSNRPNCRHSSSRSSGQARSDSSGQALVTLIFFMIVSILITTASIIIIATNSLSATTLEQHDAAYYIAESGAENALLRLLRDPGYTGEVLPISDGNATILVSGANPYTIDSEGKQGNFIHKIRLSATYTNNVLTVNSWEEVY